MPKNELLNAYLAVGADDLKRIRVLERLKKRLEEYGDISFNSDVFNGSTASGEDIVSACNTLPFASEKRLIEVREADKLNKSASEALVEYLKSPCDSTVLLLTSEKLAKNTRLYKAIAAIGKNAVIECNPMKRHELATALRSMAVSHGFSMTPGACERLLDLVGEDTVRIDTELKKIAIAHDGNDPVTDAEVSSLVAQTREAKPWDLVDAFSARNLARCFHLLSLLKNTSDFSLLAQCQNRIRELLCVKSLERQGNARNLAAVLSLPPWRVKNHSRWAAGFTEEELIGALISARDTEKNMKSGSNQDAAFQDWLCSVIAKRSS